MISNNLNLKTEIRIGDQIFPFELFNINDGDITKIKFNNEVFIKENGLEAPKSDEKPGVFVEKIDIKPKKLKKLSISNGQKIELLKEDLKKESKKINFNNKVLATYNVAVYDQCWNYVYFRLKDRKTFRHKDVFKILSKWYYDVLARDLENKNIVTQKSYSGSYIQYGINSNKFVRIQNGLFKITKPSESTTIVNPDNEIVKGFAEHKRKMIDGIKKREREFYKGGGVTS